MRTVHKYEIGALVSPVRLNLQYHDKVVLAGVQDTRYYMWIEYEPDSPAPTNKKEFKIFGTGFDIPDGWSHEYSFQEGNMYVWHVYSKVIG